MIWYKANGFARINKTKDWALVQTAALVINKGVEVKFSNVRENNMAQPTYLKISYPNLILT